MKVYSITEFFMSENILEEVTTKVFADKNEAQEAFELKAQLIYDTCVENVGEKNISEYDGECAVVYQKNDKVCDAWRSFSASEWEWCVKLEEHII